MLAVGVSLCHRLCGVHDSMLIHTCCAMLAMHVAHLLKQVRPCSGNYYTYQIPGCKREGYEVVVIVCRYFEAASQH